MASNALGKTLIATVSTAVALASVEVAMRLLWRPPLLHEDSLRTYTEYDPELGWRGRAGAKGLYRTRLFTIEVSLNDQGWRDGSFPSPLLKPDQARGAPRAGGADPSARREIGEAEPESAWAGGPREKRGRAASRIALLGDSFAWGYGVNRGEMFADRIEKALPETDVLNFGVCGFGTDQEFLVLKRSALPYEPSVVLLEFALGNDIENILSSRAYRLPKPRFLIDGGVLRLEGVPVERLEQWERPARTGVRDFLTQHWRTFGWARERWARARPRVGRLVRLLQEDLPDGIRIQLLERARSDRIENGWALAESLLEAIRSESEKGGAAVVVLAVPDRLQVDAGLWQSVVNELRLDPDAHDLDLPSRRIAEIGQRLGIVVVDPLEALRDSVERGADVFLTDDPHWNAEGHRLAARELVAAIEPILRARGDPR